jgi:hypothetical protein
VFSEFILRTVLKKRADWLGLPERCLLAVAGFVVLAAILMVAHVITGGAIFGTPFVVPIAALVFLFLARGRVDVPRGISWARTAAFICVLLVVFLVPALMGGSSVRTGDPPWHLGWTEQLLSGEPVPTGPAPEYSRNAYPWGWHAVHATLVRLIPGTDPMVAHEAMHIVLLLAIPLAAACLGRRIDRRAGWWAAAAAAFIGGFGWIAAGEPAFVTTPTHARFGADLVVASPNSVYELLPPPLPREMGLVVLAAAAVVIAWARSSGEGRVVATAGVLVGVVGLVSVPLFTSAIAWVVAAWLVSRGSWRHAALLAGVGALVFGFWAGPVVSSFVRFGGFVNITPQLGKEWDLWTAFTSWGLLLPLAVAGIVVAARIRSVEGRAFLGFVVGTGLLLAFSIARGAFDWNLAGNATLLHQGRVWPPAHLLGAACAGAALVVAYNWLRARSRALGILVTTGVFAMGGISPAFAARSLTDVIENYEDGFSYGSENVARDSFVDRASEVLSPDDLVGVPSDHNLAFLLFQFSGCRIAEYDDPRLDGNDLRIRYEELADEWNDRVAGRGFRPDYIALPEGSAGQQAVVRGEYEGETWVLLKLSQ